MKKQDVKYSVISEYYEQHVDDVRAYVRSRIKDADEANDIVQNVFLKLLSSDTIVTANTLASLVYTMARNMIIDYCRHYQYVEEYMRYSSLNDDRVLNEATVYSVKEIYELVENGIATLKESQRKIYRMNLYEGLPVSDISKSLNLKYKTVENKLGIARKEIRKYIGRMLA